jgi:hypothetical protein
MDFDLEQTAYKPTIGVRRIHETPLVVATNESLQGYGCLVEDPQRFPIQIVRWPAQGWRQIDTNSGDQGGVTEGVFEFWWRGDTLCARNNAVGDSYLFGWSTWPEEARRTGPGQARSQALIWRANYHPDGGQLVSPARGQAFASRFPCASRRFLDASVEQCLARPGAGVKISKSALSRARRPKPLRRRLQALPDHRAAPGRRPPNGAAGRCR